MADSLFDDILNGLHIVVGRGLHLHVSGQLQFCMQTAYSGAILWDHA